MKAMSKCIFLCGVCFLSLVLCQAETTVSVSSSVLVRDSHSVLYPIQWDTSLLDTYRSDEAFNYREVPKDQLSLKEKIKQWLYETFIEPFDVNSASSWFDRLMNIVFVVVFIGALIYTMFRLNRRRITSPETRIGEVLKDPTSKKAADYQALIRQMEDTGDLNMALKYSYLYAIQQLDEQNHIQYRPDLTNAQVIRSIKDKQWSSTFKQLAMWFERIWYGHYDIPEHEYRHLNSQLSQLIVTE